VAGQADESLRWHFQSTGAGTTVFSEELSGAIALNLPLNRTLAGWLFATISIACHAGTTQEFTLANGLRLIISEDHRAPVAVSQVWYAVGSSHETDGITGISHVLEHMMFKGTAERGPGEFSEIVAARGGQENAFTSYDYTAYYQQWSAAEVPLSFELEADRMQNLKLDPAEFVKERNVVIEERRLRTDDNPQALAMETTMATAFQTSSYRHPVIGWEADLKQLTVGDLERWYRRWYQPSNAIVIVVGDVDPPVVRAAAEKTFGAIEGRPVAAPKHLPEVLQRGLKRVEFTSESARVPMLMMGFKAPTLTQSAPEDAWEIYALELVAAILDGSSSSRLARKLVRGEGLASQVHIGYSSTARQASLFSLSGVPRGSVTLDRLEDALLEEIALLQTEAPSEEELARCRTQAVAEEVFERDSVQHQAYAIGALAAVGLDWRLKDGYLDELMAITPEQVREVAAKYLVRDRLTVTHLLPGGAE
jgi:zinc protease